MRLLKQAVLMCSLLFSALALLAIFSVRNLPAQTGRGGQVASQNGDVDCDGRLTINDPVKLLNYMFLGGPEPCAIAQEQSPCCPELAAKLDQILAAVQSLQPRDPDSRFVDNGDGTMTDTWNAVMWQRDYAKADLDLDGVTEEIFNFNQAQFIAKQSRVGGNSDWRLPTYKDYASLLRYISEKPFNTNNIPEFAFGLNNASPYWSSSLYNPLSNAYFAVRFIDKHMEPHGSDEKLHLLLVRDIK